MMSRTLCFAFTLAFVPWGFALPSAGTDQDPINGVFQVCDQSPTDEKLSMKEIRENQNCLNLLIQLSGSTNANTTFMNEVFSDLDKDNDGFVSKVEVYAAKIEDRGIRWGETCDLFGQTKKNCDECLQYQACDAWNNAGGDTFVLCNCESGYCEGWQTLKAYGSIQLKSVRQNYCPDLLIQFLDQNNLTYWPHPL